MYGADVSAIPGSELPSTRALLLHNLLRLTSTGKHGPGFSFALVMDVDAGAGLCGRTPPSERATCHHQPSRFAPDLSNRARTTLTSKL